MHKLYARSGLAFTLFISWVDSCWALDSYRFLHVTIETPWLIFIFLLFAVLAPFVLMGVLVWRYAEKRIDPEEPSQPPHEGQE